MTSWQWQPLDTPPAPSPDTAVTAACQQLTRDVERIAHNITALIIEKEPRYADSVDAADLLASVHNNVLDILATLGGQHRVGTEAPAATGRARAGQGVPLEMVERAFRLGMSYLWEELVAILGRSTDTRCSLVGSASTAWGTLDVYIEAVAHAYHDVNLERLDRTGRRHQAAIASLFDHVHAYGRSLSEIALTLHLPTTGTFVVIATDPLNAEDARPERSPEQTLAAAGVQSAWRSDTEEALGLVALTPGYPVSRLAAYLSSFDSGRTGLSATFQGLQQTAAAVSDARLARSAAVRGTHEVIRFEQSTIAVLLAAEPDLSKNLARQAFGKLDDLPAADQALLLQTLAAWFDAKGSSADTAAALHCHPNTVRYRMTKLRQLTGRCCDDPKDVTLLYLGLQAHRMLPNALDSQAGGRA